MANGGKDPWAKMLMVGHPAIPGTLKWILNDAAPTDAVNIVRDRHREEEQANGRRRLPPSDDSRSKEVATIGEDTSIPSPLAPKHRCYLCSIYVERISYHPWH